MKPVLKCFECGERISTESDRVWMRDRSKYFHPNCFAKYLKAKNRQQHRGLPEKLYANPSEVK